MRQGSRLEAVAQRRSRRGAPCTGATLDSSRRPYAMPSCGPKNLYGEQMSTSTPHRGDVDRPVRPVVDGVRPGQAPALVRELGDRRTSVSVPTAFEATGNATTRVRSVSCRSRSSRSSVVSSRMSANRTVEAPVVSQLEPRRHVRVVVEPGDDDLVSASNRARKCARARISVLMFGPKTTSSAGAAEKRRRVARARRQLLGPAACPYGPLCSRSTRGSTEIASITSSGTCVPPGPSKKTKAPRCNASTCAERRRRPGSCRLLSPNWRATSASRSAVSPALPLHSAWRSPFRRAAGTSVRCDCARDVGALEPALLRVTGRDPDRQVAPRLDTLGEEPRLVLAAGHLSVPPRTLPASTRTSARPWGCVEGLVLPRSTMSTIQRARSRTSIDLHGPVSAGGARIVPPRAGRRAQ